jgi:sRNA-binding regulator protein Hfq
MNGKELPPGTVSESTTPSVRPEQRIHKGPPAMLPMRLQAHTGYEQDPHRQAEFFYLQKQIQAQTPMVIVLDDGERIEGCIEWYDSNALKVRGHSRTLIYKSSIKYMYKLGEG